MKLIVRCNCGCGTIVYREEDHLFIQSVVIGDGPNGPKTEIAKFVKNGFVNGKYSLLPDDLAAIEQELQFEKQ